uniref:hypothetical protein n=1 Tax=Amycolatopsis sp. CA-096443 TaxID=3239919 RepID=UPI003F496524
MWTSDDALNQLAARGYRAVPFAGSPGQPDMTLFTRGWDEPFTDQVVIRGEDDATAFRFRRVDGADAPERTDCVWYAAGTVVKVVDALIFDLPHPAHPRAPRAAITVPDTLVLPPGARADAHAQLSS